jgi:hypothetical protein
MNDKKYLEALQEAKREQIQGLLNVTAGTEQNDKPETPIRWYSQQELDDYVAEAKRYSFWKGAGVWSMVLAGGMVLGRILGHVSEWLGFLK